jgi:hypothetical protein
MIKLQVVVGSTREGRNADAIVHWLVPVASSHGAFEVEVLDLRDTVLVGQVQEAFGADGAPVHPAHSAGLKIMLDDLSWWGELLKPARATQLPPGGFRLRAALAWRTRKTGRHEGEN